MEKIKKRYKKNDFKTLPIYSSIKNTKKLKNPEQSFALVQNKKILIYSSKKK